MENNSLKMDTERKFFSGNIQAPGKQKSIFELPIPVLVSHGGKKVILVIYFIIYTNSMPMKWSKTSATPREKCI